jgi:hypothetical protein
MPDEGDDVINWKSVLACAIAALVVVALIVGIVWNGEHDRRSRERLGRDCIASGGTWTHGDCLRVGAP